MNCFECIIHLISGYGKSWEDVKFISNSFDSKYSSSRDHIYEIDKKDFEEIAKTIPEDSRFISLSLKIVGDGWFLNRVNGVNVDYWDITIFPKKPDDIMNKAKLYLSDLSKNGDSESLFILRNEEL